MDNRLQELKFVLQTLDLPITGQVRLIEDDCSRIEILAGAFAAAHHAVHAETGGALTPEQATTLAELDNRLARVRQQSQAPLCSELAMRQSADWRQVRKIARQALVRFSWTLEVPPREALRSDRYPN